MQYQDIKILLSEVEIYKKHSDLRLSNLSKSLEIQGLKAELQVLKSDLEQEQFLCDYFRHMYYQLLGE